MQSTFQKPEIYWPNQFTDDLFILVEPQADGSTRLSAWERTSGYGGDYFHNVQKCVGGIWYGRVSNRITPCRQRAHWRMAFYMGLVLRGMAAYRFTICRGTGCYYVRSTETVQG